MRTNELANTQARTLRYAGGSIQLEPNEEIYDVEFSFIGGRVSADLSKIIDSQHCSSVGIMVTRLGKFVLHGETGGITDVGNPEFLGRDIKRHEAIEFLSLFCAHPELRCSHVYKRGRVAGDEKENCLTNLFRPGPGLLVIPSA